LTCPQKGQGSGVSMNQDGKNRENLVEIKVFGQTFTVKTDSEESHILEVAQYVNDKIEEILKKTRTVSSLNVAILAALNVADDLLKERERRKALLREVGMKSRDLVEKIDMKIGGKEAENVSIVE
jgi:cell division protein ZapA